MARLFGAGHHPITDVPLGREYPPLAPPAQQIEMQVAALPSGLSPAAQEAKIVTITAAEKGKTSRTAVAGFDITFSVPKSVSVLWALSDADTQRAIVDAHHAAVATTLGLLETDVARTRTGHGGTARIPVRGLVAAGFDHHDSRTVTAVRRDGTIRAQASGGQPVILPADYVAQHVELGYAVTAHRCQGVTVDTTHTIASGRMTREAFYVAMTRGRTANRAYIDTDTCHGDLDNLSREPETRPARTVLEQVLANQGAEASAHAL